MTAELYADDAPDAEDFLVCWMQPVMRSAVERDSDDVLPFCVVTDVSGDDDPNAGTDDPILQVEFFGDGAEAAKNAKRDGHRRMMLLARELRNVTLSDGSVANPDYVDTVLKPKRMPYAHDRVVRYVARYQLGLSYVAIV